MKYDSYLIIANGRSGHNFISMNIFSWIGVIRNWNIKAYNLENFSPHLFDKNMDFSGFVESPRNLDQNKRNQYQTRHRYIDFNEKILKVVSSRDYLNWGASYMAMQFRNPEKMKTPMRELIRRFSSTGTTNTWLNIAKEFKGFTNYIPDCHRISYEKFKDDKTYRQKICSDIGGEYNEDRLERVTHFGDGSSFDYKDYQFKASEMKTNERYKQMIDLPYFPVYIQMIKSNKAALGFYKQFFPLTEDQKHFIKEYIK